MSATPPPAPGPPPPPHAPPPPRPPARAVGCLPFMVFLLTIICAGGIFALRCGCLPKENAARAVIEIMDSPTSAEMKAHRKRIMSEVIFRKVARDQRPENEPPRFVNEIADRIRETVSVTADGPFLTITACANDLDAAERIAGGVAREYGEYLNALSDDASRRVSQMLVARISSLESTVEKARIEWLDIMRKHDLIPDGRSPALEATISELAARLSKAKANLAELESVRDSLAAKDVEEAAAAALITRPGDSVLANALDHFRSLKAPPPEATPAEAAAALDKARNYLTEQINGVREQNANSRRSYSLQIAGLEKAAKEQEIEVLARIQRRSEMDTAKENYDSQKRLLNTLQNERMTRNVKESVMKMPIRSIEEAHATEVPRRDIRRHVRFTVIVSAVLLAAFLLAAFASRLCHRNP